MLQFEAEVFDTDILEGLERLDAAFSTFKVPIQHGLEVAAVSIGEGMERGGVPESFAPLAASTLYQTASYRLGGPLLREGVMEEAAIDTRGNRKGSAYALADTEGSVGLDVNTELGRIGAILTAGAPAHNLPPRPFIRVLDSDVEHILDGFGDYVDKAVERAFHARGGNWN